MQDKLASSVIPAQAGIQLASGSERNKSNLRPTIVSAIESLSRRRRGAAGFRLFAGMTLSAKISFVIKQCVSV
ncbi:MAG: hypothetical protein ABTQ34_07335 [Bdellovibrionales bacterium]